MAEKTLRELLERELEKRNESPDDLVRITVDRANTGDLSLEDLEAYAGDVGFGAAALPNLYAWTQQYVYFKHVYDGAESVYSAPRWPDTEDDPRRFG